MSALYIHVPFCLSKCAYCDFYSVGMDHQLVDVYIKSLLCELELKGRLWGGALNTIYFGGGTPSCLEPELVAAALSQCGRFFSWSRDTEVTFEANPGSICKDYLERISSLGVNRLSIGLQSAQSHHLRRLGRRHTLDDFLQAIEDAKAIGLNNISADAIYGLPLQTCAEYLETLRVITAAGVQHVSVYALQVEPNTPFHDLYSQGKLSVPTDEEVVEMMLKGREYLLLQGYNQYEISNFARPGFESRHNITYWRNEEYLGVGPGAASYITGRRFVNVADLSRYAEMLSIGYLPTGSCEHLDFEHSMGETMILGLRLTIEGVSRERFKERYGVDPLLQYKQAIDKWSDLGYLEVTPEAIRLTEKALPVASQVQVAFLP